MPVWKRNILICWIGCFTTACGISLVVPFLSFFIQELGVKDLSTVEQLSGFTFAITFFVAAIMSPVWGSLADTKGRKFVLMFTGLGLSVASFLTGFSVNIYMLIFFRILQGFISGFTPAATSFIAAQTPSGKAGWALATLSTGTTAGNLIGPVIGGYLDEMMGMRNVFFVTAFFLFLSFLVVKLFLVEKVKTEPKEIISNAQTADRKKIWSMVTAKYLVFGLLLSSCIINTANQSIEPIVSLYVKQLLKFSHIAGTHTSLYSGVVMSATGFGIMLTASAIGRIGDKTSYIKVMKISIILCSIIFIPMAFVKDAWQLMGLRFIFGIAEAGIAPAISTMLKKLSPDNISGKVFGYNQGAQYTGLVIGPMLGGQVASHLGFSCIFYITSALLAANFVMMIVLSKTNKAKLKELKL